MLRHVPGMLGILAISSVLCCARAFANEGVENIKLLYPHFKIEPVDSNDGADAQNISGAQTNNPPNPDKSNRQEKPAQPGATSEPDHPQASSRPVKPASGQPAHPPSGKHPENDRLTSPQEKAVLRGDSSNAPDRDGKRSVPTPARREISQDKAIAPNAEPAAVPDSGTAVRSQSEMDGRRTNDEEQWRERAEHRSEEGAGRPRHSDGDLAQAAGAAVGGDRLPTEGEVHAQIQQNNWRQQSQWRGHDGDRPWRDDRWTPQQREDWRQRHQNDPDWRERHQYYVPQQDWPEDLRYRRAHPNSYPRHDRNDYYRRNYNSPYYYYSPAYYDNYYDNKDTYYYNRNSSMNDDDDSAPAPVYAQNYYYSGGGYQANPQPHVTNTPPAVGALVSGLSDSYPDVMIQGAQYKTLNGVYYQEVDGGFEVVPPPPGYENVFIADGPRSANGEPTVIVSLQRPGGELVEIKLVRFGEHGFKGPKGERYDELPTFEELRASYL